MENPQDRKGHKTTARGRYGSETAATGVKHKTEDGRSTRLPWERDNPLTGFPTKYSQFLVAG